MKLRSVRALPCEIGKTIDYSTDSFKDKLMAQSVTNELILEHLKQVQSKLSNMAAEIAETRSDIRSLKGHVASMLQAEASKDGEIAAMKSRIEHRLEIRS